AAIRPEITAAAGKVSTDVQAAIAQQLGPAIASVRNDLGARVDALAGGLPSAVSAEIGRQIGPRLDGLNASLTSLSGRLDQAQTRLTAHDATVAELQTQAAQSARDGAAARDALAASLRSEMDQRARAQSSALDARLAQADTVNQQRVGQAMADAQKTMTAQIQG